MVWGGRWEEGSVWGTHVPERQRRKNTGNTCSGHAAPTWVSRWDVDRCECAACAYVYVCVCARACVCMWVRACRELAPGQPRTPDRAGISARAVLARPAPYLQAPLCLLQRERRIDTADGAGAAASRPPLNVCVCARVAASSSPAPNQREYSTEARGTQGGGQGSGGRNQSLRDLTASLAASRVGGMSNRKVGKCG